MSDDLPGDIRAYHSRTKHSSRHYALGPAFLDWDSQPDPFRSFEGARRIDLPLGLDADTPPFGRLDGRPAAALDRSGLGLFLELALGLSAWKETGDARWALRNNPSSGNLHPTEGWVILPPLAGIGDGPGLYHYSAFHHALEERCRLEAMPADLPPGAFLLGLSSIVWREAWKYGERAFRYCQHDCGHALAAASYAAACLGWRVRALSGPGDEDLAALLGLDRADSCHRYEPEHPDLLALVSPLPLDEPALIPVGGTWAGQANRLSEDHEVWPVIGQALRLSEKPTQPPLASPPSVPSPSLPASAEPTASLIRRRRSAQAMDGATAMDKAALLRLLAATLPDAARVPWSSFPWPARLALFLFVHRVEGLAPGLYALIRDPSSLERLKAACSPAFTWDEAAPGVLPLYRLALDDYRWPSIALSCQQSIAGRGAFSLGMVAEFDRTLEEEGQWAYRRLFWEAGILGQVLYLEATAAGLSGTGIGCYLDDEVHEMLGLDPDSTAWQSLYHFTVGGAVEDRRIGTSPAYAHLARAAATASRAVS
ncbi:MAG: SagB/ThcOx family dehydrogenase [Magnetospirillum sp.]|nr:SagB/ThcOx family dehydrogenase [Magnetospirillum sp.]